MNQTRILIHSTFGLPGKTRGILLEKPPNSLFPLPGKTYKRKTILGEEQKFFWSTAFVTSSLLRKVLNVACIPVPDSPFCPHVIENLATPLLVTQHERSHQSQV